MTLSLSAPRRLSFPSPLRPAPVRTIDVLVDGFNVTARVGAGQTLSFLRDLALATADLASAKRTRATVHFYQHNDTWELGVERAGADALLSVYRGGGLPDVAVHERRLPGRALFEGVGRALETVFEKVADGTSNQAELAYARRTLGAVNGWSLDPSAASDVHLRVEGNLTAPLAFSCDFSVRCPDPSPRPTVARADLFSLLVHGQLQVWAHGVPRQVGNAFVLLLTERLIALAEEALGCAQRSIGLHRREDIAGTRLGVRLDPAGNLALLLGRLRTTPHETGDVSPGLDAPTFAAAVAAFGRSLSRTLLRHDRSQAHNLRFRAFRLALRRLAAQLQPDVAMVEPRLNAHPEGYQAYALDQRSEAAPGAASSLGHGKLRYEPRWVAAVPGIDLDTTFLCGERLVVGGRRETACLDRTTGTVLWQRSSRRALCLPTPGGLARVHPDGTLHLHDYATGEILLDTLLAPTRGAPTAGLVVDAGGLPKLLVVTEGDRHLSAVDLVSGEVRWRQVVRRGDRCRLRRAGRLLLEVSGEGSLTALDVATGDVVWRTCDPRPFRAMPTLDRDTLAACTGDDHGETRLYVFDAWSGAVRFAAAVPSSLRVVGAPLITDHAIAVVTQNDRGLGVLAFDRTSGHLRYTLEPGLVSSGASWMAVDTMLLANTEEGHLVGIDGETGKLIYRLVLGTVTEDTCPRRLEPVLRSGALFVPQQHVHVIRPRDGAELGRIPTELVPDLLRVDERCDVYVAEESGHVAAFGAGPRLTLVRGERTV